MKKKKMDGLGQNDQNLECKMAVVITDEMRAKLLEDLELVKQGPPECICPAKRDMMVYTRWADMEKGEIHGGWKCMACGYEIPFVRIKGDGKNK